MKKSVSVLFIALFTLLAHAAVLSPEQALSRLDKGMWKVSASDGRAPQLVKTIRTDGIPALYIFDRTAQGGWLVVSANDRVQPLWGFSDTGSFDPADMPPALECYLEMLATNVAYASTSPMRASHAAISPSLTEQWNQKAPFNQKTPVDNGVQCSTGCVATAFAQIIHHNRYPSSGTGVASYDWSAPSGASKTLTYTFTGHTFDFNNMLNSYNGSYTSTQAAAVADLMYACGVSFKSTYKSTGTGSTIFRAAKGLIENFNYDKGMRVESALWHSASDWDNIVYNNIRDFGPTFMSASDNLGGHAFVLDGYSNGYYHINWGWGGSKDGYFLLASLNPYTSGSTGFIYDQLILCALQKPKAGSVPDKKFTWTSSVYFIPSGRTLMLKSDTKQGCFSYSTVDVEKVNFGAEFVDASGNSFFAEGMEVANVAPGTGYYNYTVELPDLAEGTYTVYGACRYDGSWHRSLGPVSKTVSGTLKIAADGSIGDSYLYLIGEPAGGWSANTGLPLSGQNDIYRTDLSLNKTSFFGFTKFLGENADDWSTTNSYRFAPTSGDCAITKAGTYPASRSSDGAWSLPAGKWQLAFDAKNYRLYVAPEGQELVIPGTSDTVVYLIGEPAGGWGANIGKEIKGTDSTFSLDLDLSTPTYFGFTQCLGADANDWSTLNAFRFGASTSDAGNPGTFTIAGEGIYPVAQPSSVAWCLNAGKWKLTLDTSAMTLKVQTVDPAPDPEDEDYDVYLIGEPAGGWIPNMGTPLSKSDDAHTINLNLDKTTYFGLAKALGADASDWSTLNANRFGPAEVDAPTSDTYSISTEGEYPVIYPSSRSWNLPTGNWILSLNPKEHKLSVTRRTTSIQDITAEDTPKFFNLQGIPVENPGPGLYIRRLGSSTTKVFIK